MIISFDYSLTSPCMCISSSGNWIDAKFWYLTDKKKYTGTFIHGKITGTLHKEWKTPEHRYDNISSHFMNIIDSNARGAVVFIEDYSMGSKGRVFNIGENCGLLKWKLWKLEHIIRLVPPTVLKKFAVGKGNADKEAMATAFVTQTGFEMSQFGSVGTNPSSDIIDAYFLMQFAFHHKGLDDQNS